VKLSALGRILDNNPFEQIETRTWNELLAFWDSLGLRRGTAENAAKQEQAIRAYESGRTEDYRIYWLIRNRQADPATYDPAFVYRATDAERAALAGHGMTDAQIAQFEANRTRQYHTLHAQVGGFTTAFDGSFRYAATADERNEILRGSSWTDHELGISITPGLLKDITNTNPIVKAPNVQGRNVALEAGVAVGETLAGIAIPTATAPQDLTDAQKVALAAAERSDLTLTDTLIAVSQRKPLNFDARQGLSVSVSPTAAGHADAGRAFLASLGDGLLHTIQAPGEARIKVRGSILNQTAATPAVQTGNLVLEAANGGIGFMPDRGSGETERALRLALAPGATIVARAAENVDLEAGGDMNVDTVFSRKQAKLAASGSVLDAHAESPLAPELNVLGDRVELSARGGSVGTRDNPLDVGVNPTGSILASATPGGVYLNGPIGRSFVIGSVSGGEEIRLSSAADMRIAGPVQGPGPIGLVAGGDIAMAPGASVHATTLGLLLDAGSLTMSDGSRITIDAGTIDIRTRGDAVITGIFTGNPTESAIAIAAGGSVLDGGDSLLDIIADTAPAAKLTITAGGTIGGNPLDVRLLNLQSSSGGLTHLDVQGSVHIVDMQAGGEVLLNAGVAAPGSITGAAIASSGGSVSATATGGGVNLASVSGAFGVHVSGDTGVTLGAATSAAGDVSAVSTAGDVGVTSATAGGSVSLTAGMNLAAGSVSASGSAQLEAAGGDLAAGSVTAGTVNLLALGNLAAGNVQAGSAVNLGAEHVTATIQHTGAGGFLAANLSNYGGGPASFAQLGASSPTGIAFGTFSLMDGSLELFAGDLAIGSAFVGNRVTIANPVTSVLIDQGDRAPQPFDIQLWAPQQPFGLTLSRNVLATDATVIHYRELTHSVLSFTPGLNPDLRQNVQRTLAIAEQEPAPRELVTGEAEVTSVTPVPLALPDCTREPLPEECR
jgi:hypothetical protein